VSGSRLWESVARVPSFCPTWAECHHFDPKGMIALCSLHADWADGCQYTKEQLREFKRAPYLSSPQVWTSQTSWLRRELILFAGGFHVNPRVFLRLEGRDVVWYNRDEKGHLLLNLDIRDENDRSVVLMEDNTWRIIGAVDGIEDIEARPRGRSLTVRAEKKLGIYFRITFDECGKEKLRKLCRDYDMRMDQRPGLQEPVGPFDQLSPESQERILSRLKPGPERNLVLLQLQMNEMLSQIPTRWESLAQAIQNKWPVTVCTMRLKMRWLSLHIHPGKEKARGWRANHTISFDSGAVWDI
jgi:hypothetical protein